MHARRERVRVLIGRASATRQKATGAMLIAVKQVLWRGG